MPVESIIHYQINMPVYSDNKQSTPKQQTLIDTLTETIGSELNILANNLDQLERLESLIHYDPKPQPTGKAESLALPFDSVTDKLQNFGTRLIGINNRLADIVSHLTTII